MRTCLIDNATLNQAALALYYSPLQHGNRSPSSMQAMLNSPALRDFDDAFVASLCTLLYCILLYDTVFTLPHPTHRGVWQELDGSDLLAPHINSLDNSNSGLSLATEFAVQRTAMRFQTPAAVEEFSRLLERLDITLPRKLGKDVLRTLRDVPLDHAKRPLASGIADRLLQVTVDVVAHSAQLPSQIALRERFAHRLWNEVPQLCFSLVYWLYYRALLYDCVCSVYNGTRAAADHVANVPTPVRADRLSLYLDAQPDTIVRTVEAAVFAGESRLLDSIKETVPTLPLVMLPMPPVIAYVLDRAPSPSHLLETAVRLRASSEVADLRATVREIQDTLVTHPDRLDGLIKVYSSIVETVRRQLGMKGSGQSPGMTVTVSPTGPEFGMDLRQIPAMRQILQRRHLARVVRMLSSLRVHTAHVATLAELYDKHFPPYRPPRMEWVRLRANKHRLLRRLSDYRPGMTEYPLVQELTDLGAAFYASWGS